MEEQQQQQQLALHSSVADGIARLAHPRLLPEERHKLVVNVWNKRSIDRQSLQHVVDLFEILLLA